MSNLWEKQRSRETDHISSRLGHRPTTVIDHIFEAKTCIRCPRNPHKQSRYFIHCSNQDWEWDSAELGSNSSHVAAESWSVGIHPTFPTHNSQPTKTGFPSCDTTEARQHRSLWSLPASVIRMWDGTERSWMAVLPDRSGTKTVRKFAWTNTSLPWESVLAMIWNAELRGRVSVRCCDSVLVLFVRSGSFSISGRYFQVLSSLLDGIVSIVGIC